MEKEIGLRLSLKERRAAIAGLKDVREEVDETGDAAERSGEKAERSSGRWKRMGGALGKAAKIAAVAGGAIVTGGALAVKTLYNIGGRFDDMVDTIRVGTGATGKQLDALNASAKRVGRDVPVAFEEIGPVLADINTRLGLTGKPLEKLTKQMIEAGRLTGTAIDVNTMSSAFSAFEIRGRKTTKAMDELWRVSQATGVGINELGVGIAKHAPALKQYGFGFEETAAWIGTLDKAGLDSNKTIGVLSKAMVTFAKDGRDPQKALRGTIDSLEGYIKAGDKAKAIAAASEIFGTRGAGQFVAAVESGQVSLDNLRKQTGATNDTIMKASRDTADWTEKWQIFKNRALLKIEPIATRVFNAIGDGGEALNRDVVPAVETFIDQMKTGEGAGGKFAAILDRGRDVLGKFGGVLKTSAKWVIENKEAVGTFVGIIGGAILIYKTWQAVTTAVAIAQGILNIALAANPIGLIVIGIAALAAGLVYAWKNSETFRNITLGAFGKVRAVISGVVGWVRANWPLLLGILTGPFGLAVVLIARNWDSIKGGATKAKDWVVDKFNGIVNAVTRMPGRVKSAAAGMFDGIKDAFKGAINWVINGWNSLEFKLPSIDTGIPGVGKVGGGSFGTPDITPLAEGGIVRAVPGGILANIGEGRWDEAVVPLNGRRYLIDGSGVTPLDAPTGMSDADLDSQVDSGSDDDAWFPTLGSRGPVTVQVVLDRRVVGEAVLDDLDDRMARK